MKSDGNSPPCRTAPPSAPSQALRAPAAWGSKGSCSSVLWGTWRDTPSSCWAWSVGGAVYLIPPRALTDLLGQLIWFILIKAEENRGTEGTDKCPSLPDYRSFYRYFNKDTNARTNSPLVLASDKTHHASALQSPLLQRLIPLRFTRNNA